MTKKQLGIIFVTLNLIQLSLFGLLVWAYIPLINNIMDNYLGYGIFPWYENDPMALILIFMALPLILGILFILKCISKKIPIVKNNIRLPLVSILCLAGMTAISTNDFYIILGCIITIITIFIILITTIKSFNNLAKI